MKVIIIGAGRMGIRHAQGVIQVPEVSQVMISDISKDALNNAKNILGDKARYCLIDELDSKQLFDTCIIAATAGNRIGLLQIAEKLQCSNILVEKPLGQGMQQVLELNDYVQQHKLNCAVNLNMRMYDSFIQLRNDLQTVPQLQGNKTITVNTGTLGIGANGIHYLDLLYFLLSADEAQLVAAEIDDALIPSGRGPQFGDFGGWAAIKFYSKGRYKGKALLSMASDSTVFGSWDIVAPHGRVYFNEVEGRRIDTLRKADSTMPVNRYFADYLPPVETAIQSPFLGDLTAKWIKALGEGKNLLPSIDESIQTHQLMFDWLSKSTTHQHIFPIT